MYVFLYDYIKQNMMKTHNCIMQIQFHCIHKKPKIFESMIFIKMMKKMLKVDLILETMNSIDLCLKKK